MPATKEKQLENMLFDYVTTNRSDYRGGNIALPVFTRYIPKPTCVRTRPPPLKDVHTLTDWKAAIPFSLLHRPKDIIGTDPTKLQEPYHKPQDEGREASQRSRPRVVMTPAVSMDDVSDRRARRLLCRDMYTSDMTRAMKEAAAPYYSVRAPLPALPSPANPIWLPKLRPPYVSPEWRKDSVSWDNRSLRAHADPTKEFWLRRK